MASPYTAWQNIVKVGGNLMTILFPSECLACGREGDWLCRDCAAECVAVTAPTCPFCDRLTDHGQTCARCRSRFPLTGNRSLWHYRGPVRQVIHGLKYRGAWASAEVLVPRLVEAGRALPMSRRANVLVTAVPSSRARLAERGYNQSEILARAVAKAGGWRFEQILKRTNVPSSQTKLRRSARFANVQNQFVLSRPQPFLSDAAIMIVDDVITTGATLAACAAALKAGGVSPVWGLTVAKD